VHYRHYHYRRYAFARMNSLGTPLGRDGSR
jgi:hypothetical protein